MRRMLPVLFVLFAACTMQLPLGAPSPSAPTASVPAIGPRLDSGMPPPPARAIRAHVVAVSDGDTIVLSGIDFGDVQQRTGGHRSRLIGIDTPEVFGHTDCFGQAASAFTKHELDGKDVLVDLDVDTIDRYGRALVYVWQSDGRFFNGRLVDEGFALQDTFPPNVRYAELFSRLVRDAREHERGLWKACR